MKWLDWPQKLRYIALALLRRGDAPQGPSCDHCRICCGPA